MLKSRISVLSIILFIIILSVQIFNADSTKSRSLMEAISNKDIENPFSEPRQAQLSQKDKDKPISELRQRPFDAKERLLDPQERPLEAYYLFAEQLEKDDVGFVIFPDDIAGTYIDNGVLYIFYTGNSYSHYEDLIPNGYPIEFIQKEYSYNYLNELQDEMMSKNTDFHMGYVDVVNNVVVLGTTVRENDLRMYQSYFERLRLPIVVEAQEALNPLPMTEYGEE